MRDRSWRDGASRKTPPHIASQWISGDCRQRFTTPSTLNGTGMKRRPHGRDSPNGSLDSRSTRAGWRVFPARLGPKGTLVYKLVTTTDHKTIGVMYIVACFAMFFAGGLMA